MRRRPPVPAIDAALLREGQERADALITEVALALRDADPVEAELPVRLEALEQAAVRAAGGVADLVFPALLAAREAAEKAAAQDGFGLRDRLRFGDHMAARLVRRLHPSTPKPKPH